MIIVKTEKIDVHELLYNLGSSKEIKFKQRHLLFLSPTPFSSSHTHTHTTFITKLTVYTCLLLLDHILE